MVDGHGLGQNRAVFPCQRYGPLQLFAVEGDGLFAQYMLAVGQGLFQEGHVGIVGGCDVDDVDVRVGEHLVVVGVDLGDAVLFRKGDALVVGAVAHGVQGTAHGLEGLGHLIGDHARAQYSPTQLLAFTHIMILPFLF